MSESDPRTIRFGTDCTADLGSEMDAQGLERALVVTGETVGASDAVMDP